MYQHILIPLENTPADETILAHIKPLARMTARSCFSSMCPTAGSREISINCKLAESEEMKQDRAYLEKRSARADR